MHEKYDPIFSKIDCLGLGKVQLKDSFGGPPDFTFRGRELSFLPVPRLGSMTWHTCMKRERKCFKIALIERTKYDIGSALNRCKSLEGLYIKANDYEFTTTYEIGQGDSSKEQSWTRSLRDVVFSFTQSSRLETALPNLVSIIKRECPNLETLGLFSCFNMNDNQYDDDGELYASNLSFCLWGPDISGIEKFTSLQYLKLVTIMRLDTMEKIVSKLPNLKKLELTFGEPDYRGKTEPWDKDVDFNSLDRLTELKINKVRKGSKEWGEGVLKNLQKVTRTLVKKSSKTYS